MGVLVYQVSKIRVLAEGHRDLTATATNQTRWKLGRSYPRIPAFSSRCTEAHLRFVVETYSITWILVTRS